MKRVHTREKARRCARQRKKDIQTDGEREELHIYPSSGLYSANGH